MKIALAQIEVLPGNPKANLLKIIDKIDQAKNEGIEILVFSEMVVGGYLLGDEWENESFVDELMKANDIIKQKSEGMVIVWGNVFVDKNKKGEDGRWRKYNSVFIAQDKQWVSNGVFEGRSYKTLMPKYREFDDERHFFSLQKLALEEGKKIEDLLLPFEVIIKDKKISLGLMLCEDMWSSDYAVDPSKELVKNGANILVNISCSPWTIQKNNKRHRVIKEHVEALKVPFLYCNNTGTQNNGKNIFLFDGSSTMYDKAGNIVKQAGKYKEEIISTEIDVDNDFSLTNSRNSENDRTTLEESDLAELYTGLVFGITRFFNSLPSKKVVIGLSGGIDSAVVAALLVEALGSENILGVNMPSVFNSELTKTAAAQLAANLNIDYKVVPIQKSVDVTIEQLKEAGLEVTSVVTENIQARDRSARILAAISACVGGVFVNNGNKTETALGYCTLYGDVSGAFAPIADLYKGQIYEMAEYINSKAGRIVIPLEIIKVVPSAELSSEQDVTIGKGDPINYPYHDKLIKAFVEWRLDPQTILQKYDTGTLTKDFGLKISIDSYFDSRESFIEDLEQKWKLYKVNIFKRIQAPPIIAVSRRAFGFDLRESQNGVYFSKEFLSQKSPLH